MDSRPGSGAKPSVGRHAGAGVPFLARPLLEKWEPREIPAPRRVRRYSQFAPLHFIRLSWYHRAALSGKTAIPLKEISYAGNHPLADSGH